jgi:hypothetical protein
MLLRCSRIVASIRDRTATHRESPGRGVSSEADFRAGHMRARLAVSPPEKSVLIERSYKK